jgi:hypothetical protein
VAIVHLLADNMRPIIIILAAIFLMGCISTWAQASSHAIITASVSPKIKVDVVNGASQSWILDLQSKFFQTTIANAVKVSCNKPTWTLSASANPAKLTSGSNVLNNDFYIQAIPTTGTGSNFTSSTAPGVLWMNGGKGVMATSLKFTQPINSKDIEATGYGTNVTFTVSIT